MVRKQLLCLALLASPTVVRAKGGGRPNSLDQDSEDFPDEPPARHSQNDKNHSIPAFQDAVDFSISHAILAKDLILFTGQYTATLIFQLAPPDNQKFAQEVFAVAEEQYTVLLKKHLKLNSLCDVFSILSTAAVTQFENVKTQISKQKALKDVQEQVLGGIPTTLKKDLKEFAANFEKKFPEHKGKGLKGLLGGEGEWLDLLFGLGFWASWCTTRRGF